MQPRILVVGSVNMDIVARVATAPEAGETVVGSQYSLACGGKGANAAVAAARMGSLSAFCGCVGDDDYGVRLRQALLNEGIDDAHLRVDSESSTGMAVIIVEDSGQNRIAVYPGANMRILPEQLGAAFTEPADVLMLQLEISRESLFASARMARERGVPIVLDAGPAQQFPLEELPPLFILSPNETETRALCGIDPSSDDACREACKTLRQRVAAEWVVLKLGERGSYIDNASDISLRVPSFPINPVDTTAAGDTFSAALTLRFLQTRDMPLSARFANAAGALCALRPGAMPSLPTAAEIEGFLAGK